MVQAIHQSSNASKRKGSAPHTLKEDKMASERVRNIEQVEPSKSLEPKDGVPVEDKLPELNKEGQGSSYNDPATKPGKK